MTLTQTVEVPVDRWLKFKVPQEVPVGKANIIIQFPVKPSERELTPEEEARIKVFPNKNMTVEEELKWINDNAEWLNKEAAENWEYQKWIFESDEGWEKDE